MLRVGVLFMLDFRQVDSRPSLLLDDTLMFPDWEVKAVILTLSFKVNESVNRNGLV